MSAVAQVAEILAVGMVTPVGLDGPSTAAAVRAGLSRRRESEVHGKDMAPLVMSILRDDALPPLAAPMPRRTEPHTRMVQLAGPALAQALAPLPGPPPPLFLALPEVRPGEVDPVGPDFLSDLAAQAGAALAPGSAKLFRQGGAGSLFALHGALSLLAGARAELALAGGVDTFLDLRRLADLDHEGRILGEGRADGFIPGEGAAFLLLARPGTARRLRLPVIAHVAGAALGAEKGHRYSKEPYRGDGLAATFQELFAVAPRGLPPVRSVYAGFNGEHLPSKEWGVAYLRSNARFAPELEIEHPADCLGDTGAASGAVQLALAALGIQKGDEPAPCLVWSTSDREARAAALLLAAS